MGRGPHWQPPRHLAGVGRPKTDAREHLVAEWLLAAVAILLTTVVLVSQMVGHGDRDNPGPASPAGPAPPATGRPPTAAPPNAAPPVATPALQARRLAKNLRWEQAIAARLVERGAGEQEALLVPKLAMACFQTAYERWVRDPGRDLAGLVDESFAALGGIAG